jgi:lysophospholipase L1-like esterase
MDTLRQGIEISRERGLQLVLGFVPIKERVYWRYIELPAASPMRSWTFWPSREKFAELCQANNVPCLDLTPVFETDITSGNMPYLPTDSHWSAHGHDLVAERVHAEIKAQGWL